MKAAAPASPVQSAWNTIIRAVKKNEGEEAANLLRTSPFVQNALLMNELDASQQTCAAVQQEGALALYEQQQQWWGRAMSVGAGGIIGGVGGYLIGSMAYEKVTGYMVNHPGWAKAVLPLSGAAIGGLTYLFGDDSPDSLAINTTFYGLAGGVFVGSIIPAAQAAIEEMNTAAPVTP